MVRVIRPQRRQVVAETQGPWRGVRDSTDVTAADPRYLRQLLNGYIEQPEIGGAVVGRPGFATAGVVAPGAVQGMIEFTTQTNTKKLIRVTNGTIQSFIWPTNTWVTDVTAAQLVSASITLSTSARVGMCVLNGELIISDGVNKPFAWNGEPGGLGLTALTNCPVLLGMPTVYYGKLFGIKMGEPQTIVWSEENQPNVGYEAGGFNNAWTLSQTSTDAVLALRGTNTALYVWRRNSITLITGAVTIDFRSTGTLDGISLAIGTSSPWSIVQAGESFWFLDSDGRPQRLQVGGRVAGDGDGRRALWTDAAELAGLVETIHLFAASGAYWSSRDLVLLACEGSDGFPLIFVYHAPTGAFMGRWKTWTAINELVVAMDVDEVERLLHAAGNQVYAWGVPGGSTWTDGGPAIEHQARLHPFFHNTRVELAHDLLDVVLRVDNQTTGLDVDVRTPNGTSTASPPNTFLAANGAEQRVQLGLADLGRWAEITLRHDTTGEQFALLQATLSSYPLAAWPEIR